MPPGGQTVGSVNVRVAPDTSEFADKLKGYLERLERTLKAVLRVEIDIDDSKLRSRLAAISRTNVPDIEVPVSPELAAGFAAELKGKVAAAARAAKATVNVDIDVDRNGGLSRAGSFLSSVGQGLSSTLGLFGSLGSVASNVGGKVAGVGDAFISMGAAGTGALSKVGPPMLAAASIVTELAGAALSAGLELVKMAAIAGTVTFAIGALAVAAGGLPGLIAAGGAAFAIMQLGADGAKKAVERIKPQMDGLKRAISSIVETKLGDTLASLASTIEGPLTRGLSVVTRSALGLVDALAGVFRTPAGQALLEKSLGNVAMLISTITPGVTNLAGAFLRVAANGSVVASLGDIINDLTNKTAVWFDMMNNSGRFSRGMEVLRTVLSSISDLLFSVLTKAADFFIGAGPGVALFFDGIKRAIDRIDFTSLGESFGMIAGAIGNVIGAIPPGAFDVIVDGVRQLAEAVANFLNSPGGIVLLTGAIVAFGFALQLAAGFVSWFAGLMNDLTLVAAQVFSFFQNLGPNITAGFESAQAAVVGFFANFVATLATTFMVIYTTVTTWLANTVASIVTKWNEAVTWVTNAVSNILAAVRSGFSTMYNVVASAVMTVVNAVRNGFNNAVAAVRSAGSSIIAAVVSAFNSVRSSISNAISTVVSVVRSGFNNVVSAMRNAMSSALAAVRSAFSSVVAAVRSGISNAVSAVRSFVGSFASAGRAIIEGVVNGVRGGVGALVGAVRNAAQTALNAAKNFLGINSPSRLFREVVGRAIPEGVGVGITKYLPYVENAARNLASKALVMTRRVMGSGIKADDFGAGVSLALNNAADNLLSRPWFDAGRDIVGELQRGLASQDLTLAGVGAGAASWRAPAPADPAPTTGGAGPTQDVVEAFAAALDGKEFVIDSQGGQVLARWVNKANEKNERR
ncbi:phage tail protein [Actinomycetospora sp. CA-053990]|uniref:phage tail protein n=1 Tax=Actinomycetospora sp. CA-053990 TaxID=3239891 RepID=UPI003D938F18